MLVCSLKIASGASMQRSLATAGVAIAPRSIDLLQRRNVSVSAAAFENDPGTPRTFAQFAIYKGKAAVAFKPITPGFKQSTFNNATYGAYNGYALEKEGVLLLEFASVLPSQGGQTGYGNRNYDWSKKVTFALKAVELAALTDLDNSDATKGVEFFHDPNKGSRNPNAVKTMKTLKISLPQGSDVYMLSINQSAGTQKSYITVPITRAEYVTLKHLAAYMIPRMFGFDLLFEGQGSVPSNVLPPEPQA